MGVTVGGLVAVIVGLLVGVIVGVLVAVIVGVIVGGVATSPIHSQPATITSMAHPSTLTMG